MPRSKAEDKVSADKVTKNEAVKREDDVVEPVDLEAEAAKVEPDAGRIPGYDQESLEKRDELAVKLAESREAVKVGGVPVTGATESDVSGEANAAATGTSKVWSSDTEQGKEATPSEADEQLAAEQERAKEKADIERQARIDKAKVDEQAVEERRDAGEAKAADKPAEQAADKKGS